MLKQILPLLFIFILSINLFAQSQDINKEITDIKLQIQEIKLLDARDDREKKIEKLETDIKKLEDEFNKNNVDKKDIDGKLEKTKDIIERQDIRLNDLNFYFFWYGILITILLFIISYISYKFTSNEAKDIVNNWIEKNKDRILEPIKNEGNDLLKNIRKEADLLLQDYQLIMKNHNLQNELDSKEKEILEKVNILLESKETKNYTFNDWNSKFLDYFYKNEFSNALKAIDNAISITTNEVEIAVSLFNKALTLSKLEKFEEEINVYNELIKRFENSKENIILEQISKALYNKSVILRKLGKLKEALEVSEQLIKMFKNSKENNILVQVANILVNKGFIFGILGKLKESLEVYDELIERFKDSKEKNILEQLSRALINKIEINLILGNKNSKENFNLIKENKQYLIQFEMLEIFDKAKNSNQDNEIEKWQIKYKDTKLGDWSFDELKTWAKTLENDAKERILRYIDIFENHNKNIEGK